jgi:hypothetical protein
MTIGSQASSTGRFTLFFWRFGVDVTEPSSESSLTILGAHGRQNTRKTGWKDMHLGSGWGLKSDWDGRRIERLGG